MHWLVLLLLTQQPDPDKLGSTLHEHHHTSPCAGQTCSGHGTCELMGDLPFCNCFEGYTSTGLSCVPDASLSAEEEDEQTKPVPRWGVVRGRAVVGALLSTMSVLFAGAGWIFRYSDERPGMVGMFVSSMATHALAGPMSLTALYGARLYASQKTRDGHLIASWAIYAAAIGIAHPMLFTLFRIDVLGIVYSAAAGLSAILLGAASARAMRISRKHIGWKKKALIPMPWMAAIPGGTAVGVGGSF
jgi:hypothetical protein